MYIRKPYRPNISKEYGVNLLIAMIFFCMIMVGTCKVQRLNKKNMKHALKY